MHTIGEKRIRMLRPRDIKRPERAVRTVFDEYELSLLRDSISAQGILQPLLVKRIKKGKYQVICGERRLLAAIMAGIRRVPCVVHNVNETAEILYSLTENLQCQGLSAFDEAKAINLLMTQKGLSLSQVAVKLGVSQSELYSKLQVLRLEPRLIQRFSAANLNFNHAKALLRLPKEGRGQVLDKIIEEGLSARQAEEYVFSILNPPIKEVREEAVEEKPVRKAAIGDLRMFGNSLAKLVESLRGGGVKAEFKRVEKDKYVEYKIRIKKEITDQNACTQLRICQ